MATDALATENSVSAAGWAGLDWTPWLSLDRQSVARHALLEQGVYRIRAAGAAALVYIGQTGRTLRSRLHALRRNVERDAPPFNDPHTAAPHLWLLRRHGGVDFEFSCAAITGSSITLRGTEDMLLWLHRVVLNRSTVANYGRFFPGWARPSNRSEGRALARLTDGPILESYERTAPVLAGTGPILAASGWDRFRLSEARISAPAGAGVYCLYDEGSTEPMYIGQAASLAKRLRSHRSVPWPGGTPWVAIRTAPERTPQYMLHEWESDLLGWHFHETRRAPRFQYRPLPRTRVPRAESGGR